MKLSVLLLICVLFAFCPHSVDAEIYKWKDENGKIHFSDTPPENQKSETREYVDSYGSEPGTKHAVKKDNENITSRKGFNNSTGTRKKKTRAERYLEIYDRDMKKKASVTNVKNKMPVTSVTDGALKFNEECHKLRKLMRKIAKKKRKAKGMSYQKYSERLIDLQFELNEKCR